MRDRRDDERSFRGWMGENEGRGEYRRGRDEERGRMWSRDEDMGGSDWSGSSGRGGMRDMGSYGRAEGGWGGQREHGGYGSYAGGGERDTSRQWGRDRDRYDRDFGGRGGFERGRGGMGQGGYGGSASYGGYQGSFGMGDYGAQPGVGYGNVGRGDMRRGGTERGDRWMGGREEGWGQRMGGSDLGFGYGEHEGREREERGPHYGKGPKGYRRSDDRIREDVCDCIAEQGRIDASDVEVKVESGTVTLSGTVGQRHDKRMLEHLVERVRGVTDVHNELRVKREEQQQQRGQQLQGNGDQARPASSQFPNGRPART